MPAPFHPSRSSSRRVAALLGAVLVVAACGGGATATVAPTAALPSIAASPVAVATAGQSPAPSVAETPEPTVSAEPPMTTPPVTDAPPTESPTPTPPPTAAAPGVGVPVAVGDQQVMTVVKAEPWPGAPGVKPRSGKAFFTVSIRIDALLVTSFASADFKLKDAAGHTYAWRTGRSPHLYDLQNMSAGNNYIGWITYEIPKASLIGLTLVYRPAFLGGRTFAIPVS